MSGSPRSPEKNLQALDIDLQVISYYGFNENHRFKLVLAIMNAKLKSVFLSFLIVEFKRSPCDTRCNGTLLFKPCKNSFL